MPTLCRAYSTVEEARAAITRLRAAGRADDEIRVLSGSAPHDHAADPVGRFAGDTTSDAPVGTFAGGERATADPKGSFAGDATLRRRGGFGDLDRDVVATYDGDVPHVRVASHRDLHGLLVDAGLDAQTARADVHALHDGRVVVLIRTDRSREDVLAALEEVPA